MLPPEIWYLVLDQLGGYEDAAALFALAQTSRTLANMALPRLYRICFAVAESRWDGDQEKIKLWRSIILSAEDKTAFPYCLWVETLRFWDLRTTLVDVSHSGRELQSLLFNSDMAPNSSSFPYDYPKAVLRKAGDTITRFVGKAAERGEHAVSLVGLQMPEEVADKLPVWVARLPTLEKLQVAASSCLTTAVATAIRDHCPRFRHLAIEGEFLIYPELETFLRALPPGCLEIFSSVGYTEMPADALGALAAAHATSLRRLELTTSSVNLPYLGALRPCVSLERLDLYDTGVDWEGDDAREGSLRPCQRSRVHRTPHREYFLDDAGELDDLGRTEADASFANAAAWLGACAELASLSLFEIPDCGELLRIALPSPPLGLRFLHVEAPGYYGSKNESGFLECLRYQTALEGFTFGWLYHGLNIPGSPAHKLLIQSLCQCPQLRALKLMETVLTATDLAMLAASLPNLEVLMFDSNTKEVLEDSAFEPLLAMPKLQRLCIDGPSRFTTEGMAAYLEAVAAQGRHTTVSFTCQTSTSEEDRELLLKRAQALGVDFKLFLEEL